MHAKTRSTLAGLTAATLFMASVWLFGHPIATAAPDTRPALIHISLASDLPHPEETIGGHGLSRVSLGMPYFSFALLRTRRGIN
jgi:hypothetical protein